MQCLGTPPASSVMQCLGTPTSIGYLAPEHAQGGIHDSSNHHQKTRLSISLLEEAAPTPQPSKRTAVSFVQCLQDRSQSHAQQTVATFRVRCGPAPRNAEPRLQYRQSTVDLQHWLRYPSLLMHPTDSSNYTHQSATNSLQFETESD